MKKSSSFIILILVPLIIAMGSGLDGDAPEKIPVPKEKFNATYIDQMDIVTECTGVSINGKTFIEGVKGEGTYTVDFKEIKNIGFFQKGGKLSATVTLKNGERVELELHKKYQAYGNTQYGTFQISIEKLKMITIRHQ